MAKSKRTYKYNQEQRALLRRLKWLDSRALTEVSKHTSLINYTRGQTTLNKLATIIKSTTSRSTLKGIRSLITTYEKYSQGLEGISQALEGVYDSHKHDEIGRFIRLVKNQGWNDWEVMVALEQAFDIIYYLPSSEVLNFDSLETFQQYLEDGEHLNHMAKLGAL